jgi:hypothetical protein
VAVLVGVVVLFGTPVLRGASWPSRPSSPQPSSQGPTATEPPAASPTESAPTPATVPPITGAAASTVVGNYFQAINDQDYQAAYALLGSSFHRRQSFANFAAGFSGTVHDDISMVASAPAGPGRYAVRIELAAGQSDGSVKRYVGTYVVGREGGASKIVSAQVRTA